MCRLCFKFCQFLLFLYVCLIHISAIQAKKAIVVVPVADLVGSPLTTSNTLFSYNDIPVAAGNPKQSRACPRSHQLLFNEIVDIIDEQNGEARVNIPSVYYLIQGSITPHTTYWTQKHNLMPIEDLEHKGIDLHKIPHPINFIDPFSVQTHTNTITLIFPWINPLTKQAFSAGTRFVLTEKKQKDHYFVYLFDPVSFSFKQTEIPKQLCLQYTDFHTPCERITLFVQLLRKWAHPNNGFIPYVWGGCSFINVYENDNFTKQDIKNTDLSYFIRDEIHSIPKNGFDCSGLIARAAQICGIPYFFKNTTTLATKLTPLQKGETLQEGDLIWIPGHVMVVANIPNNTIIEARGYGSGYGKVHELPLNKLFKDLNTYTELLNTYFATKPLYLLTKEGEISSTISTYKLLKLSSAWDKKAHSL